MSASASSAAKPASSSKAETPKKRKRPWRENIEAVTMALVMAVMLKYFIIEAYKIPTGSMQPTLLGNDDTNIYDRILVDKLSYHFRDPKRFEVAVFRYPLDRSKNFIKRIVGVGGEDFRIAHGDLWSRPDADTPWQILRRPRRVQQETWKHLDPEAGWRIEGSSRGWEIEGTQIRAEGEGAARFPGDRSSIKDRYKDGYPGSMADRIQHRSRSQGTYDVGDLRLEMRVEASADCAVVRIELLEGSVHYRLSLPGPAATDEARLSIERVDLKAGAEGSASGESLSVMADEAWRLRAGKGVKVAGQNLDDLVELEVNGKVVLELEVPSVPDPEYARVRVATLGGGATFDQLAVSRDIHYTNDRGARPWWTIPEGHYFMMGDNTQDSADSREWHFARYRMNLDPDDHRGSREGDSEASIRGNSRERENPLVVPGGVEGPQVFFRDEWGERHVFDLRAAQRLDDESAPFVPRELMTGRALLVFWPFVPSLDVWRLKWIR